MMDPHSNAEMIVSVPKLLTPDPRNMTCVPIVIWFKLPPGQLQFYAVFSTPPAQVAYLSSDNMIGFIWSFLKIVILIRGPV